MSEMTAKQMAENAKNRLMCDEFGDGWYSFSYDEFRQFCDQLCREQRDECYEVLLKIPACWRNDMDFIKSELLNAETPDL